MSNPDSPQLPIGEKPPAFGCLVYIKKTKAGVTARVANLDGIEIEASDERAALGKIVPAFRAKVAEQMESGGDVAWIDPPSAKADDEQKRFLPVHL